MSEDYFERLERYREKVSQLREYSQMISNESSETWVLLCELFGYTDYVSDEMKEQIYKEIDYQLKQIDEWYDVYEKTTERTVESKTYKYLEPKY